MLTVDLKAALVSKREYDHIWGKEVVLLAEGVNDQKVADYTRDANCKDDRANGVVGVVGHIYCGKGIRDLGRHRHLEDKA